MEKKEVWNYYGVKIIKQILVEGEPDLNLIDKDFDNSDIQSFEESIILVRARSFDEAYEIAECKSTEFDKPYENPYGQIVNWKFIEAVDCYLILETLESGTEVYSCFHNVDSNISARDFIDKWFDLESDGEFNKL